MHVTSGAIGQQQVNVLLANRQLIGLDGLFVVPLVVIPDRAEVISTDLDISDISAFLDVILASVDAYSEDGVCGRKRLNDITARSTSTSLELTVTDHSSERYG